MARKKDTAQADNAAAKKPTPTRVYMVAHKETGDAFALIEATSAAQALSIVTADLYTVSVPSPLATAKLMENGVTLKLRDASPNSGAEA